MANVRRSLPASFGTMVRQKHALSIVAGLDQLEQRIFFHPGMLTVHAVLAVIP